MTQFDALHTDYALRPLRPSRGLTWLRCILMLGCFGMFGSTRATAAPPSSNVAAVTPVDTAVKALLLDQTPPLLSADRLPTGVAGALPQTSVPGMSSPSSGLGSSRLTSQVLSEERLLQAVPTIFAIAVLGIGPLLILLTTGFVRISIVLALLRQAFGTAQVPSNQVMGALSLLLTLLLMTPVWNEVYQKAIVPLQEPGSSVTVMEACDRGRVPVQAFMIRQLEHTGGADEVWLFWKHARQTEAVPATYEEVPFRVLLPAFVLNELKTAFLIGFQIYLPFLVIDLLVAGTTMAMGLSSLPSQSLSIPLKLVMFVLVDGWHLVVDLLLRSFMG